MNLLYLLKALESETNKLSEIVANIDAPLIDINLALWEAEAAGEIEIDRKTDRIKRLKEPDTNHDEDLANKIIRVVQHYISREENVTVGKLTSWVKNPGIEHNYPYHDYVVALQYLIDSGTILEEIVTLPKIKTRPFRRFVFLCLPNNPNEEWNSKAVNKWIADWEKSKVK